MLWCKLSACPRMTGTAQVATASRQPGRSCCRTSVALEAAWVGEAGWAAASAWQLHLNTWQVSSHMHSSLGQRPVLKQLDHAPAGAPLQEHAYFDSADWALSKQGLKPADSAGAAPGPAPTALPPMLTSEQPVRRKTRCPPCAT